MSFALTALVATSSPILAQGVEHSPTVTASALATLNTLAQPMVPEDDTVTESSTVEQDDAPEFDSLAEAVAAHDAEAVADETAESVATRCLAGAIYFESKGEPLAGQLAVARVILNRARSGRFPADVCGVVTQRGQFGFVRGGQIPHVNEAVRAWRTAIAVARVALADAWETRVPKALYFNTPGRLPGARLTKIAAIGNHIFYR